MARKTEQKEEKLVAKEPEIPIGKYFQLYGFGIHPYTQAYVGAEFRGIMKTKEEWTHTLGEYMEGNK